MRKIWNLRQLRCWSACWVAATGLVLVSSIGCKSTTEKGQLAEQTHNPPLATYEQLSSKQKADLSFTNARSLEMSGEIERAITVYKDTLKLEPNHAESCARIAVCMDKVGRMEESGEWYDKALKLKPGNPDLYCDRGYSFYLQQKYQEAEIVLRQCLAIKRDHQRAHNNLGLVLAHTGRADEAVSCFHNGGSTPALAHQNVAVAMLEQGDFATSEKHYRLALATDPNLASAKQGLGELNQIVATSARRQAVLADTGSAPVVSPASNTQSSIPPLLAAVPAKVQPQAIPAAEQPAVNQPVTYVAPTTPAAPATPAVHTVSDAAVQAPAAKEVQPQPKAAAKPAPSARRLQFSAGALRRDRYLEEQSEATVQVTDEN